MVLVETFVKPPVNRVSYVESGGNRIIGQILVRVIAIVEIPIRLGAVLVWIDPELETLIDDGILRPLLTGRALKLL